MRETIVTLLADGSTPDYVDTISYEEFCRLCRGYRKSEDGRVWYFEFYYKGNNWGMAVPHYYDDSIYSCRARAYKAWCDKVKEYNEEQKRKAAERKPPERQYRLIYNPYEEGTDDWLKYEEYGS